MPELPEVETIMQGLKPHLEGEMIENVVIRHHQLRWPIDMELNDYLKKSQVAQLSRRGKYLLIHTDKGTLIIHLGMSGRLRIVTGTTPLGRHDHVDILFSDNKILRYTDPRRFGALLWTKDNPYHHVLLNSLGVEPLDTSFTVDYLMQQAHSRRIPVKSFIMNSKVVVGIGNIYAAEALFLAGIHPMTPVGALSETQHQHLIDAIKRVLQSAIKQGGTTIKDFLNSEGKPGYFTQQLSVYGREGLPCVRCQTPLLSFKLAARSTVFCIHCQPIKPS